MKRSVVLAAVLLSFVFLPVVASANDSVFESQTVGFKVVKPASWVFMSPEELIRRRANASLVAMTKYPEPHDGLNPGVQVTVSPLGAAKDMPVKDILEQKFGMIKSMADDFTVIDGIRDVEVGGLKGVYTKASYSIEGPDGRRYEILTRVWFLKRGTSTFMIGASGPQSGPDISEAEFSEIIASIEIAK